MYSTVSQTHVKAQNSVHGTGLQRYLGQGYKGTSSGSTGTQWDRDTMGQGHRGSTHIPMCTITSPIESCQSYHEQTQS